MWQILAAAKGVVASDSGLRGPDGKAPKNTKAAEVAAHEVL
jgi:hypothetical protein